VASRDTDIQQQEKEELRAERIREQLAFKMKSDLYKSRAQDKEQTKEPP
jgi:hypothetical protein